MIELCAVTKSFRRLDETVSVLQGIDLTVDKGDLVAVVGPSGSGKSTLMNIIGCLDTPTSGHYRLDGKNVSELGERELAWERSWRMGFVFQNFQLISHANVRTNVAQPLVYRGVPRETRYEMAEQIIERVGLGHRLSHTPGELSGGQRQKVAIARALVGSPQLLLADEPTGSLDSDSAAEVMKLLQELHEQGLTIILVTHEAGIAEKCRRLVSMQSGLIVGDRPFSRSRAYA